MYEIYRGGRRVAFCSPQAQDLGARVGMPLAEVTALAGSSGRGRAVNKTASGGRAVHRAASGGREGCCATSSRGFVGVVHAEALDPLGDRQALEQLGRECQSFSPLVGMEDTPSPESLLLDITGLAHLFGGEAALAEKLLKEFGRQGWVARIAIADTIGAAWAEAHFGETGKNDAILPATGNDPFVVPPLGGLLKNRLKAELRTSAISSRGQYDLQLPALDPRPSTLDSIPPGRSLEALRPLPIEALRLPKETLDLLHQLGVYRVGELELLPRADLAARFGPCLAQRWDQAMGNVFEPIRALPLSPEWEAQESLEYPTTRQEVIDRVLEQLIGRLTGILIGCGRGVVRLECRLDCPPESPREFSLGLFETSVSPQHLLKLLRMQLERVRLPGPVSAVHVRAALTARLRSQQEELFCESLLQQCRRRLADLVDRLSARLGNRSVLRARLTAEAQPELAYGYEPLGHGPRSPGGVARRGPAKMDLSSSDLPPRPLRLEREPSPVEAASVVPDGPPLWFGFGKRQHRVVHAWGPERIETGWWRGRGARRDYYRVETDTGRRYWLFRRLGDEKWFLHGAFE